MPTNVSQSPDNGLEILIVYINIPARPGQEWVCSETGPGLGALPAAFSQCRDQLHTPVSFWLPTAPEIDPSWPVFKTLQ